MDTYSSMTSLLAALPARENYVFNIGRSFRSKVKIFVPHGGCIEPCTEPLALAVANGLFDHFAFRGVRKKDCFRTLHVTSTHYDEPQCISMARESGIAVAFHGCDGAEELIQIGGGNTTYAQELRTLLCGKGYPAVAASRGILGEDDRNFINLAAMKGLQLEFSAGFRKRLFPSFPGSLQRHPTDLPAFVEVLRGWLVDIENSV